MVDQALLSTNDVLDELLVKGEDGKFYVLRGETLVPVEEESGRGEPGGAGPGFAEDDVTAFASRAATVPKPLSPEEFIHEVLAGASIHVDDAVIQSRLEKALALFFKDLRDRLETKEVLMRSPKVGGVGLAEEQIDALLKNADAKRSAWLEAMNPKPIEHTLVVPPIAPRPPTPTAPVLEKTKSVPGVAVEKREEVRKSAPPPNLPIVAEEPKPKIVEPVRPGVLIPKAAPPPAPASPPIALKPKFVAPSVPSGQTLVTSPQPSPHRRGEGEVREVSIPVKPATGGRPLIMDVIPPPARAVGPVEELRYDLPTYRRLGNASAASSKILEKIKLLFQSSWKEGIDGVTAWKESPVMRFVFDAMQQSINKNIPITTAIQDTLQSGKPMVTGDEWSVCMELLGKIDAFVQGGK